MYLCVRGAGVGSVLVEVSFDATPTYSPQPVLNFVDGVCPSKLLSGHRTYKTTNTKQASEGL